MLGGRGHLALGVGRSRRQPQPLPPLQCRERRLRGSHRRGLLGHRAQRRLLLAAAEQCRRRRFRRRAALLLLLLLLLILRGPHPLLGPGQPGLRALGRHASAAPPEQHAANIFRRARSVAAMAFAAASSAAASSASAATTRPLRFAPATRRCASSTAAPMAEAT